MNSSFNKIFLILTLIANFVFSQKYELGKVTIDELKQNIHPVDSSASAAILFKKGETKFEVDGQGHWYLVTEIEFKIKIYKKEGLQYANYEVPYYVRGEGENVFYSDAVTYNLVDGKIEKTKLKSDGNFKEKLNDDWMIKKISMPKVQEGSIIEYSYKLKSPYVHNLNDFYFQREIPVDYVEYNLYIPEYFNFRNILTGYESVSINDYELMSGDFPQKKHTYIGKNIPAMKSENYVNNIKNYASILKSELISVSYPGVPIKNVSVDWEAVIKGIYSSSNFGGQLEGNSFFEEDLKTILEGLNTNEEKVGAIFHFVQNKLACNGKRGVFAKEGVRRAYKEGVGNVSEINLILISMLKKAGIEANPVILSTRDNGVALFPNAYAFNYVIAGVEVLNDVILLDASNKNVPVNLLPLEAVNWKGRIIRERGSSAEIDLMNIPSSKENVVILGNIQNDGVVEVKMRKQKTDYYSYMHRENNMDISEDTYLEKKEKLYDVEIKEYKVENMRDLYKPIIETFNLTYDKGVEIIGDKMYVCPLLFFRMKENPFKIENRKYPVDFEFANKNTYSISIKIPDNYEIEYLPEATSFLMDGNFCTFKYNITSNSNGFQLLVNFDINSMLVPSQSYPALKNFFKMVVEKENEKIILKKKN